MADRPYIMLGIESSCDETAAAIIGSDKTIYANEIASQMTQHAEYGGVVPEVAARAHLEAIDEVHQWKVDCEKEGEEDDESCPAAATPHASPPRAVAREALATVLVRLAVIKWRRLLCQRLRGRGWRKR